MFIQTGSFHKNRRKLAVGKEKMTTEKSGKNHERGGKKKGEEEKRGKKVPSDLIGKTSQIYSHPLFEEDGRKEGYREKLRRGEGLETKRGKEKKGKIRTPPFVLCQC